MTNTTSARKPRVSVKTAAPVKTAKVKAAAPATQKIASAKPAAETSVHAAKAKHKLVRDSFTIPKDEYQVLDALKRRVLGLEQHVRKSELLRAGIQVLSAMNDKALLKALNAVPTLKTGRPKAD